MKKTGLIVLLCTLMAVVGLKAQDPVIKMIKVDSIGTHTAFFVGELESMGSWNVKNLGFMYAPVEDCLPGDTFVYSKIAWKATEFEFKPFSLANYLLPGRQYWVKAWVTKGAGKNVDTCFSDPMLFQTLPPVCPTVEMYDSMVVGLTKLKMIARVDSLGDGEAYLGCGFICSDSTNPTMRTEGAKTVKVENSLTEYMLPLEYEGMITGLEASTGYYCRAWVAVRYNANRVDTCYSDQVYVVTHDACDAAPTKVDTLMLSYDQAIIKWLPAEGQIQWEVEYGPAGHVQGGAGALRVIVDTVDSLRIVGLESNRTYTVSVRAVCGGKVSLWSDVKSFRTLEAPCAEITSLHLEELTYLNAKIAWVAGSSSHSSWDVAFAKAPLSYPTTPFTVHKPEYAPVGLQPNTEYKVKVRSNCWPIYSEWSDELKFTTYKSSIEELNQSRKITVYPNPSDGIINLQGDLHAVQKIEVYSQIGTLVYSKQSFTERIDLSECASGTYYLQITKDNEVQVEKIIIN